MHAREKNESVQLNSRQELIMLCCSTECSSAWGCAGSKIPQCDRYTELNHYLHRFRHWSCFMGLIVSSISTNFLREFRRGPSMRDYESATKAYK